MVKRKISTIMVVHNEEELIERALKSVKDISDEILILHDGPCNDKTLKIARKYTKKVFVNKKNVGLPGPIIPILLRKAKGPWILKLDADEFLSKDLKRNIRELIENPDADAYVFRWPFWNGKKYITKDWPSKPSLYRKSKISYFGFPHWDDPRVNGNAIRTNFQLEHRPKLKYPPFSWKDFVRRGLKRYMVIQAEYTLKDFDSFDKFQWREKDFQLSIRLRRKYPVLTSFPIGILAFFKTLISGKVWKEGYPVFFEAYTTFIYYTCLGFYIRGLKSGRIKRKFTD